MATLQTTINQQLKSVPPTHLGQILLIKPHCFSFAINKNKKSPKVSLKANLIPTITQTLHHCNRSHIIAGRIQLAGI